MLYAIGADNQRVYADDATKDSVYYCPICGAEVFLRMGEVYVHHFAHKACSCADSWNYDMSEWHKRMQARFPKEMREVVMEKGGVKHRADVLFSDVVIEFQHSHISTSEFNDRNEFYLSLGYRVAWVFDVSAVSKENIRKHWAKPDIYRWKHPLRVLQSVIPQFSKTISILLCSSSITQADNTGTENDEAIIFDKIQRINWACLDGGIPTYRYISMNDDLCLTLSSEMDPDELFLAPRDFVRNYLAKNGPYQIKCPEDSGLGIDSCRCSIDGRYITDSLCSSCSFCLLKEKLILESSEQNAIYYCAFPRAVIKDGKVKSISLTRGRS